MIVNEDTGEIVEPIDPGEFEPLDLATYQHYARVLRARMKAQEAPRKAWMLGKSSINGDECYEVYSLEHLGARGPYYVRAHPDESMGGHCYALNGHEPLVWLRCSCPASEYDNPCWHAAKTYLRILRERKRHATQDK